MLDTILNAIAPVFMVLGLGYFCGWKKIADNKDVEVLNVFVMRFAIPFSLFTTTWHTPVAKFLTEMPLILVLSTSMVILWFFSYFIARKVFKKDPAPASIYAQTIAAPNYAAMGIPILAAALGPGHPASLHVAIALACGSIFLAPLTLMVLQKESKEEYKDSSMSSLLFPLLISSLKNPIVFWPILGTVLSISGTTMPDILTQSLKPLAIAGGGSALFLTGLIVSARSLKLTSAVSVGFVLKNLIHPFLAFGIATALGLPATLVASSVLLSALAPGFFGVMFGDGLDVHDADSEGTLLLGTVLFVLTIPIFMLIMK